MSKPIDQAFPPIEGEKVRVLVLGSMPSQRSLEVQQYYAHPQNAFWKIMSRIFSLSSDLTYQGRAEILKVHHIGVWDVIHSCHRPGSMDADIERDSIAVNDFSEFFKTHPELECVLFNGQAAAKTFARHFGRDFMANQCLRTHVMPSTSPAYAAMSFDEKYKHWRDALEFVL